MQNALRSPCPAKHLLSKYLQRVAVQRYARLYNLGDERDRARLLSAGGPTAGASLVSLPCSDCAFYNDSNWRTVIQWRLGITGTPRRCRNESRSRKKRGELCDAPLDGDGDHALCCMRGGARYATHNCIADRICDFITEAGAKARRVVYVREFCKRGQPDWTFGHGARQTSSTCWWM